MAAAGLGLFAQRLFWRLVSLGLDLLLSLPLQGIEWGMSTMTESCRGPAGLLQWCNLAYSRSK